MWKIVLQWKMNLFIVAGYQVGMLHAPFTFVISCIGSLTIYFTFSWIHSKCIVCIFGRGRYSMLLPYAVILQFPNFTCMIYLSIYLSVLCMSMYVYPSIHPAISVCLFILLHIVVFWVMRPCSLVCKHQHFEGTYYLYFQGGKWKWTKETFFVLF
jgi:hypothetical protein